eukprot:9277809-Pyramimonas_sp.AAC.1
MESEARRAHGYLKDNTTPHKFQYKGLAEQALDACSLEQRTKQERTKWSTAWGCREGPRDIPTFGTYPVPVTQLPSPEETKRVSKRFKPRA